MAERARRSRAVDTNLKRADLEKLKFFLTVNSRAPEVNLFNKPRIGLWPIQVNPSYRNPKDQLLAFCTSTGTGKTLFPYYFQRQSVYYPGSGPNSGYNGITTFSPTTPSSQSTWIDYALSGAQANNPNSRNTLLYSLSSKSDQAKHSRFRRQLSNQVRSAVAHRISAIAIRFSQRCST